ncbi:MAG: DUF1343 domain-containing protein [Melioribacteraceae bacterium]|nr:DUF1343 domain-containing protein [Melioribacteraceae bacterium]
MNISKAQNSDVKVTVGADVLLSEEFNLIKNRSIGIITNHSAILSSGTHLVDTLFSLNDIKIKALFGPEHGIRGDAPDGHSIKDGIDTKTGLPVYSLYGKNRKPTKEMLKGIDLIIFDIQDIGARFYTYISTLYYAIQSSAENDIPIIVLDRPNPINGLTVDGPIRKEEFKSFVAIAPIPIQHGLTIGELAIMFNDESWIDTDRKADLTVVKIKNWKREYFFDDCNLKWVNPSPNMPSLNTAIIYPGMCLIEGVNVSEGRGTYSPFLQIGAPYINSKELLNALNKFDHPGISLEEITFTPESIANMSVKPKYLNEKCNGIKITITDKNEIQSLKFGIQVLYSINKLYPKEFKYRRNWLDKLFGDIYLKEMLESGITPDEIYSVWKDDVEKFKQLRNKYLLY